MIVNYIENNLIKNTIKEEVTETEIICDKCNHRWDIDKGGEDLYVCHKCGHDNTPKKKIKEDLQSNANIVIRQITKEDLKQIIPRLGEVFNKTGLSSQEIWGMMQHSDFNKSVVATIDDKIVGFYFFSNEQIPETRNEIYYELKNLNGIEGVALGIFEEYKNLGIGKKLIEYTKSIPGVDYIWGYQLKSLKNIDDWLKRRKIYAENDYMYVTYQLFNKSLSENFKKKLIKEQITKTKIICDNCGWSWNIKDGGKDLYICHKCGHDNNPNILNERCWKGYTQKGMKTMFGKRYPNCVKSKK
jgi:DNA-directed RNA polymerase subunit RPC12/RpoP/predicted DNA-binding transcriptional regulator AlpA